MGKSIHNNVLDAALNYIKSNATNLDVCSTEPTTYAEAHATYMLAEVVIDSDDFTGPAEGDVSGRKLTVNEQADITVSNTGTAAHVALTNGSDTLILVTTCTEQSLTAANTVTVPTFDDEILDPA